jgi:sugar phosphate isomerase/epimerase
MYTRRDFGRTALAALPIANAVARGKAIDSKIAGVQLGTQSYSFRDLSFDDALKAMAADGLGDCELFAQHIEEGHTGKPPAGMRPAGAAPPEGRRTQNDPAQVAARKAAREELRKWRLTVPMDYFKGIRQKFSDAGVNLYAYNLSFNDSFTDEEIDRGFDMAKALGVNIITASTTLPVAKRVAPFADKHRLTVAMHGHSNLTDPNQFAKPESFAQALEMSKHFKINLDIGHFTAANYDAVDYIQKNHDNIVLLHLKDRKKNEGPNTEWGQGDTPIKAVLLLLKEKQWPIPAFIEYEYRGTGSSQEEVKKCYDYAKRILEA